MGQRIRLHGHGTNGLELRPYSKVTRNRCVKIWRLFCDFGHHVSFILQTRLTG